MWNKYSAMLRICSALHALRWVLHFIFQILHSTNFHFLVFDVFAFIRLKTSCFMRSFLPAVSLMFKDARCGQNTLFYSTFLARQFTPINIVAYRGHNYGQK